MACQTKMLLQNTVSHETRNTDDLDCPPPLTRPFMGDIEEALNKLQDLSFFSSYGDEIRSFTLKIETILNKEQTEGLKQSHLTDFFQVVKLDCKVYKFDVW